MRARITQEAPFSYRPSWPALYDLIYVPPGTIVTVQGAAVQSARTDNDPATTWVPVASPAPIAARRFTAVLERTTPPNLGIAEIPPEARPGSAHVPNSPTPPTGTQTVARRASAFIPANRTYYVPQQFLQFIADPIVVAVPPKSKRSVAAPIVASLATVTFAALLARAARYW